MKIGTGMTEESHLSFYFRGDKQLFLRKQESILTGIILQFTLTGTEMVSKYFSIW